MSFADRQDMREKNNHNHDGREGCDEKDLREYSTNEDQTKEEGTRVEPDADETRNCMPRKTPKPGQNGKDQFKPLVHPE